MRSQSLMINVREHLNKMETDNWMNYVREMRSQSLTINVREQLNKMETDNWMNHVLDKLKEFLLVLQNFGGSVLDWFDKVFPPDTRGDQLRPWPHVGAPFLIAAVVLITCIWCCKCLRRCCCGRGIGVKMMKAPGRNLRMPRHVFESNPRSYFSNLRANPGGKLV
ncbi:hypothetical protein RJ639_027106 [Escallonia herrerae]|uniref:Uncharacterized protein n=1 Tax=Escallonia herrerae TaxID=1293975 RepID=A0AA89BG94_9ASTE|nr:hypothetical protein RJ639_027106 [Escallonia herrerae]